MPVTYAQCGEDVQDIVDESCRKDHEHLLDVKIDLLFASNDTGNDVSVHGYPAVAKVRKLPLKDRVAGRGDAEIVISQSWWSKHTDPAERMAVIDHELTHLEWDQEATDDIGRPKLHMRLHDLEVGAFMEVIQRNKQLAVEAQSLVNFITGADGQMLLEWTKRK